MSWKTPDKPVVLISGASRGIGYAIAKAFAYKGATLAICSKSSKIYHAAERLREREERVFAEICDTSSYPQVKGFVSRVVAEFSRVDVLVNNAAVITVGELGEVRVEDWRRMLDVNVSGYFYLSKEVLPYMISQGGGVIVNIVSGAAHGVIPGLVPYCITKVSELYLARGIALEYGHKGIRAYSICPGETDTDMLKQVLGDGVDPRRVLSPEEVAEKVLRVVYGIERLENGGCLDVYR